MLVVLALAMSSFGKHGLPSLKLDEVAGLNAALVSGGIERTTCVGVDAPEASAVTVTALTFAEAGAAPRAGVAWARGEGNAAMADLARRLDDLTKAAFLASSVPSTLDNSLSS